MQHKRPSRLPTLAWLRAEVARASGESLGFRASANRRVLPAQHLFYFRLLWLQMVSIPLAQTRCGYQGGTIFRSHAMASCVSGKSRTPLEIYARSLADGADATGFNAGT